MIRLTMVLVLALFTIGSALRAEHEIDDSWNHAVVGERVFIEGIDDVAGFEIGNGRTLVTNFPGQYWLEIKGKNWLIGTDNTQTEVLAISDSGILHARLRILIQKVEKDSDKDWIKPENTVAIGRTKGTESSTYLDNGKAVVEFRVVRGNELIRIQVEGYLESGNLTPFNNFYDAIKHTLRVDK